MTTKIMQLTPDQEAYLPIFQGEWLQRGLATGPCDHATIEASAKKIYESCGKEFPKIIVWMSSPLGGAFASAALNQPPLSDQLWNQLRDQLGNQLRYQLRDQLGNQLWNQLWNQLGDKLGNQLGDKLRDQLWDQLRDQLGDQLNYAMWGQHDIPWTAWYEFGRHVGVQYTDAQNLWLDGQIGMSNAGWWWPTEGVVIFTERPSVIHRDAQGRLHSEHEMAIGYKGGWGVYAVHGVRVSEQVILNPESLTIEQIMIGENTEVRRVMCERLLAKGARLADLLYEIGYDEEIPESGLRDKAKAALKEWTAG